jgi:hypothetical protein
LAKNKIETTIEAAPTMAVALFRLKSMFIIFKFYNFYFK